MENVSILSLLLCGLALASGAYMANAFQKSLDYDDMRVSNNQFQEPINYHGVSSDDDLMRRRTVETIRKRYGDPFVPLPPSQKVPVQQQSTVTVASVDPERTSQEKKNKFRYVAQKQMSQQQPQVTSAGQQFVKLDGRQIPTMILKSAPLDRCDYMSLQEFKNISMQNSGLIIMDANDQPCYILILRAYIKRDQNSYFPLSNLKVHPYASRVMLESPGDGAGMQVAALNCSLPAGDGAVTATTRRILLPMQQPHLSFREEITISVDCGYLILYTRGDGSRLSLEGISFYQNANIPSRTPLPRTNRESRAAPKLRSELLVFSTEGLATPLFTIPMISRYACQNRIELTGKNSIQLVLDRFELQRLNYPNATPKDYYAESPLAPVFRGNKYSATIADNVAVPGAKTTDTAAAADGNIDASPVVSSVTKKSEAIREKRDSSSIAQLEALSMQGNSMSLVTRCPNPTKPTPNSPFITLTYMMKPTSGCGHGNNSDTMRKFVADGWIPIESSSFSLSAPFGVHTTGKLGTQLGMLNYALTLCLSKLLLGRFAGISSDGAFG